METKESRMHSTIGDTSAEIVSPSRQENGVMAWVRRNRWFVLCVILPTLLAAIYYGLLAADQYSSQSRFVIKSPTQKQASTSSLANLLQTTGLSSGQEQTNEILDYIRSRNALRDAEKRTNVKAKFMSPEADFFSRYPAFWKEDKFENLYEYYTGKVDAHLDNVTGVAVLEIKAFTPEDARELNARLLDLSEELVNRLNERSQQKAIAEGTRRVAEAETRVRKARLALSVFRNAQNLIDPAKQATGVLEISNKLVSEQATLQAQLDVMLRVAPANPAIPALRNRIAAIGRAAAAQSGRAAGSSGAIASKLVEYENLILEQEFAAQMLSVTNASLEQARTEAQKQQFYLERVVEPDLPDLALYPSRLVQVLTIAVGLLFLYFIGWMLIVGILEHAPED